MMLNKYIIQHKHDFVSIPYACKVISIITEDVYNIPLEIAGIVTLTEVHFAIE